MGHELGSQQAGVSVHTGSGRQGGVYLPLSAPHPFSPHSQASRRCGQTGRQKGCLRDSQAATQRMRGVPHPGCLLQGGPVLPGRAEEHLRGPRAWILFRCPIAGPPCPLCWLPESGGFCPGPIYKLPVLCKVLGDPLFPLVLT